MNAEEARKIANSYLFTIEPISSIREVNKVIKSAASLGMSEFQCFVRKENVESIKNKLKRKGFLATSDGEDALAISVALNINWRHWDDYVL